MLTHVRAAFLVTIIALYNGCAWASSTLIIELVVDLRPFIILELVRWTALTLFYHSNGHHSVPVNPDTYNHES